MVRSANMMAARERRREALEKVLADAAQGRIKDVDGWKHFSPAERAVIGVCPFFSTKQEAVAYALDVPNPSKWLENHSVRTPGFREACDARLDMAGEILAEHERRYHSGLVGLGVWHLDRIISAPSHGPGRVTDAQRLKAIRMVFEANGFL